MAAQAAKEAVCDAKLDDEFISSGNVGCIIGSTMGGAEALTEAFEMILPDKDLNNAPGMQFFKCVSHTAAMNVSQYLNITGSVLSTSAACASSLQAMGVAFDLIRTGTQTAVLCGGSEEAAATVTGSFDVLFATSTHYNDDPIHASRPFDAKRDGLVCGEGAGVVVLEEYEHAIQRGAKIYGEVIGYNTCSSGAHVSQSSKEAMAKCFHAAMKQADIKADDVDYISAHATATVHGDDAEAEAIESIFGNRVPVSSLKGHIGHTLGASGAIEIAATLRMMEDSKIVPTLNLEEPSEKCAGIQHVIGTSLNKELNIIIKNCFAFGGINASIVIKKI
jgi:3-oxoacyl-[acyl-carrier-protein] synthase II